MENTEKQSGKWLPFIDPDSRPYSDLTTEEKTLRHIESIDKNIRFFTWIVMISFFISAFGMLYFVATQPSHRY